MRASSCARWWARGCASPSRRRSTRSTTTARWAQPRAERATALRRAGQLLALKGSYGAARRLLEKALLLAEEAQHAAERVEVRAALAEVRYLRGEYADAERLCNEGLACGADVPES